MNQPFNVTTVVAALLLSLTCAACGRAALSSQVSQSDELRSNVLDETNRSAMHDTDRFAFEDAAGARASRRLAEDSGLQDVRATQRGWAASDAR